MNTQGHAALWGTGIGIVVLLGLFTFVIGLPRYEREETIRLTEIGPDASFHYPVPIPGDETLCAGNVTITTTNPTSLGDGMTYTTFAAGDGECAYKTTVRVLRWRRPFT